MVKIPPFTQPGTKPVFLIAVASIMLSFTHSKITWVAIGDSITYLNEHTDETGPRVTKGYMTRVKEKLPYIHYINQGITDGRPRWYS